MRGTNDAAAKSATAADARVQFAAVAQVNAATNTRIVLLKLLQRHLAPELHQLYDQFDPFLASIDASSAQPSPDKTSAQSDRGPLDGLHETLHRLLGDTNTTQQAQHKPAEVAHIELARLRAQALEAVALRTSPTTAFLEQLELAQQTATQPLDTALAAARLGVELALGSFPDECLRLARLTEIPIAELTLSKPHWLCDARHPARAWLHALASFAPYSNTHSVTQAREKLYRALSQVLCDSPDWNPAQLLITSAHCTSERQTVTLTQIAQAQETAERELAQRIAGKSLAAPVVRFLSDYWKGLLVLEHAQLAGAMRTACQRTFVQNGP